LVDVVVVVVVEVDAGGAAAVWVWVTVVDEVGPVTVSVRVVVVVDALLVTVVVVDFDRVVPVWVRLALRLLERLLTVSEPHATRASAHRTAIAPAASRPRITCHHPVCVNLV
jgi:hypothetical protein